eukprot:COSAG01_NODE_44638_length_417_cov_0.619497_2_plen_62_part_01
MMNEIDEDGSGLVEFDEYWAWWTKGVTSVRFPWRIAALSFFKQKTAYEILRSDWSSDVCSSD